MTSAASVLVCALSVLGRSAESFPPIELLDVRPRSVSANAEAFVDRNIGIIYILTGSSTFLAAQRSPHRCGNLKALRKLASIIVHEEWHVRNGSDERGAYSAQLISLILLGEQPGSPLFASVHRSMRAVLDEQKRMAAERIARAW